MDQVCFTGESLCQSFAGHTLKANMCTGCMKDVAKHKKEVVTPEELIKVWKIIHFFFLRNYSPIENWKIPGFQNSDCME